MERTVGFEPTLCQIRSLGDCPVVDVRMVARAGVEPSLTGLKDRAPHRKRNAPYLAEESNPDLLRVKQRPCR